MSCRNHMNQNIRVCSPEDSVSAFAIVARSESLPVLFVVSPDEVLLGIVTRQALLSASWLHPEFSMREVMSEILVYCHPEDDTDAAAYQLLRSGAPVVLIEEDNDVIGWIAPHDLAKLTRLGPMGTTPLRASRPLGQPQYS